MTGKPKDQQDQFGRVSTIISNALLKELPDKTELAHYSPSSDIHVITIEQLGIRITIHR